MYGCNGADYYRRSYYRAVVGDVGCRDIAGEHGAGSVRSILPNDFA